MGADRLSGDADAHVLDLACLVSQDLPALADPTLLPGSVSQSPILSVSIQFFWQCTYTLQKASGRQKKPAVMADFTCLSSLICTVTGINGNLPQPLSPIEAAGRLCHRPFRWRTCADCNNVCSVPMQAA